MPVRSALNADQEKELWRAWSEDRDQAARSALIENYLPLARMLAAKQYVQRQILEAEFDEYRQYAIVGMIEAIDRYDTNRNATFATYASHRINGAILDGIARSCEKQQQIAARAELRQQRFQSVQDHSGEKGSKEDLFAELANLAIGVALGYMLEDTGMYQDREKEHVDNFYDRQELAQLKKILRGIVDVLPDRARNVVRYHYYQGKSFAEIAETLKLSKGRISQIHSEALKLLRDIYTNAQSINLKL